MRKLLLWGFTVLFVLLVAWMLSKTVARLRAANEAKDKITTLDSLPIVRMDSSKYEFPNPATAVVILFNTTCEHCQYEASEIKKSINSFSQSSILMISSEGIKTIKAFAEQYDLHTEPSVTFAKINPEDHYKTFGSVSIPHIFIYGKDHKLIKEFKGETKIEAILKYLP